MKVRIAVAIDDTSGNYDAAGDSFSKANLISSTASANLSEEGCTVTRVVWVEADIPEPTVVQGKVSR